MKENEGAKRILIYVGITFLITYLVEIFVLRHLIGSDDVAQNAIAQAVTIGVMLIPALSVVITRLVTHEGFADAWVTPHLKGNIKYYLIAWFGPAVMTVIGAVIYFLIFPGEYDSQMNNAIKIYADQGMQFTTQQLRISTISQLVTAVVIAPVLNFITCFGEEWGWRGYLVPKLSERMSFVPMALISGLIWGLWHAPLIAMGHNYGTDYSGAPYLGILSMCLFCIVIGTIFSYLCLKTKSCIPGVIGHGALNGFAQAGIIFSKDGGNPFIGPSPTGIVGGIGFIMAACFIMFLVSKNNGFHNS